MHVNNKKMAKIFFRISLLILEDNFAPIFAVNMLVEITKATIKIFTYPSEYGGKPSILIPKNI